jgi:hypothetical protein
VFDKQGFVGIEARHILEELVRHLER